MCDIFINNKQFDMIHLLIRNKFSICDIGTLGLKNDELHVLDVNSQTGTMKIDDSSKMQLTQETQYVYKSYQDHTFQIGDFKIEYKKEFVESDQDKEEEEESEQLKINLDSTNSMN